MFFRYVLPFSKQAVFIFFVKCSYMRYMSEINRIKKSVVKDKAFVAGLRNFPD